MRALRNPCKQFSCEIWRQQGSLEYVGVNKRIILKCILKKYSFRIFSDLTQDWVQWKAPVKREFLDFIESRAFLYRLKTVGFWSPPIKCRKIMGVSPTGYYPYWECLLISSFQPGLCQTGSNTLYLELFCCWILFKGNKLKVSYSNQRGDYQGLWLVYGRTDTCRGIW
jgi:hypothetical protein